jgi:hypothetical protein
MENINFTITRTYTEDCTPGVLSVDTGSDFCDTMELPWLDNQQDISCIPEGVYTYTKFFSPRMKTTVLLLHGTDPRKNVEVHWGNTVLNIDGCILVGTKGTLEVAGKLYQAVLNSDSTLERLIGIASDTGQITITS